MALAVIVPTVRTSAQEATSSRLALVVLVHPNNSVTDLSLDELRAIFFLERQFWPNGRRIHVLMPAPGTSERSVLLPVIYRISDAELRKAWLARLFSGDIPAVPATLASQASPAAEVLRNEGAIAVVRSEADADGARILRLDHLAPSDDGYPLALEVPTQAQSSRGGQ